MKTCDLLLCLSSENRLRPRLRHQLRGLNRVAGLVASCELVDLVQLLEDVSAGFTYVMCGLQLEYLTDRQPERNKIVLRTAVLTPRLSSNSSS